MAITLTDGRGELYQWDTGRTLTVDDATVTQVHFQNRAYGRTIDVDVKDGTAIVPDELLQKAGELRVYAFAGTAASGFTKVERVYNIVRRNKPNDYMYTPTDQKTLDDLQKQIGNLDNLETKAKDNLVAAINEANKSGSGGGEITSEDIENALGYIPVNPFWAHATIVNYTNATIEESFDEIITAVAGGKTVAMIAEFVNEKNALQATAIIPLTAIQGDGKSVQFAAVGDKGFPATITIIMSANQSPQVHLRGIVTSIDDEVGDVTSNAVKFEPQSLSENEKAQARKNIGINPEDKNISMTNPVGVDSDGKLWSTADTSLAITGATVGQIAKITAVDDSGKPTTWEAVDMPSGGGGDLSWIEVADITTEEQTQQLIISTDKDGRPISRYNAIEMISLIYVPADATQTSNSGSLWIYPYPKIGTTFYRYVANFATWKTIARTQSYAWAGSTTGVLWTSASPNLALSNVVDMNGDADFMSGLCVYVHQSGDHIPAGTRVRIAVLSKGVTA